MTRRVVLARDDHHCVRCGGEASDVHHRKVKGMGGTGDEDLKYGFENLISLCRACHFYVHSQVADSYKTGFLVHSWDDPESIGVITKSWDVITFRSDGSFEQTGPYEFF